MPLTIQGDISKNDIRIADKFRNECEGLVVLHGEGATLLIQEPKVSGRLFCTLASGAAIETGPGCIFGNMTLHALAPGARIVIGSEVGFNGTVSIAAHEPSSIVVGDNCLFASGVTLNSSDIHHIFDAKSHKRVNPAKDISIERDVWLGANCTVLKGTHVAAGSVAGAASVLSGYYRPNCVVAGVPARVIRRNVYWRR